MKLRHLILVTLAAYLVWLAATIPARWAWQLLPADLPVQAHQIEGSIWRGQAALDLPLELQARPVHWQWLPASLLRGQLGYALNLSLSFGETRALVRTRGPEKLHLSDLLLQANLAAAPLQASAGIPLHGAAQLQLDEFVLENGLPGDAEGTLSLENLAVELGEKLELGDFVADITSEAGQIVGRVSDRGGPLAAEGDIRLNGTRLEIDLRLTPRASAAPALRDALGLIGRPRADGSVRLRQTLTLF